jgi:hypothetical protein
LKKKGLMVQMSHQKEEQMKAKAEVIFDAGTRLLRLYSRKAITSILRYIWREAMERGYRRAIEDISSGKVAINRVQFHRALLRK